MTNQKRIELNRAWFFVFSAASPFTLSETENPSTKHAVVVFIICNQPRTENLT